MRLLHFADLHIGITNYSRIDPETGLESRLLDFLNTLDFIVDTAIKEKVDAVLFAGDAYKTRDPSPTQQRGFGQRLKKLSKNNIPVVLTVGNHDTPNVESKANTLDIYSALEIDNIYVSRKVEFLIIPTKSGKLQVITLPWLHKEDYKTIGEKLVSMYGQIKSDMPTVLVSHAEVEGASYGSEKALALANDVTIPLSLLTDRRLSYVALGHIHKHQKLAKNPLVVYSGSPERVDFGEEKEEKGFCLVTIKNGQSDYDFISTNARQFLTITIDLQALDPDPTATILNAIKKQALDDKIVRVIINIPADLDKEIAIDKVKKALLTTHCVARISRNIERKDRPKIDGTEEIERLTPIEALRKYFEAKKIDFKRIKELENYASQLLET